MTFRRYYNASSQCSRATRGNSGCAVVDTACLGPYGSSSHLNSRVCSCRPNAATSRNTSAPDEAAGNSRSDCDHVQTTEPRQNRTCTLPREQLQRFLSQAHPPRILTLTVERDMWRPPAAKGGIYPRGATSAVCFCTHNHRPIGMARRRSTDQRVLTAARPVVEVGTVRARGFVVFSTGHATGWSRAAFSAPVSFGTAAKLALRYRQLPQGTAHGVSTPRPIRAAVPLLCWELRGTKHGDDAEPAPHYYVRVWRLQKHLD